MNRKHVFYWCIVGSLTLMFCGCGDDSSKDGDARVPENTAELCQDGIDNDGNGRIDCKDDGCKAFAFCQEAEDGKENTLVACQDGNDNDGDGLVDCDDPDCQAFTICQKKKAENTEDLCKDGIDNDGNGLVDCKDDGCKSFAFCQEAEAGKEDTLVACQDGNDNDGDGLIDCDDSDCQVFAICQKKPENTEALCKDGLDNDGNGLADCDDPNCAAFDHCKPKENTEALCQDGLDNDGDGLIDCADSDCAAFDHCKPKENTEALCSDEVDNDGDDLVDCNDPDCLVFEHCAAYRIAENSAELCSDGIDNDADGVKDCDSISCKHFDVCMGGGKVGEDTLELCSDGIDNDGDGLVDCADVECKGFQHCLGKKADDVTKEMCSDKIDSDGDGLIDCADPDCQQFTDICSDECPDDPYKYAPDKCGCGETWVVDSRLENGGGCFINISTPEDFMQIQKKAKAGDTDVLNKNYILKRSIDFGETSDYEPLLEFGGIFEGNGKRISGVFNFDMDTITWEHDIGLFGGLQENNSDEETVTLRNLVVGITVNVVNAKARRAYGTLIGKTRGGATVENISGTSKLYVIFNDDIESVLEEYLHLNVGGLAGDFAGGDFIRNIYLHGSNTSVEFIVKQDLKKDKDNKFDFGPQTISVGGVAGEIGKPFVIKNVHANTNVTLLADVEIKTYSMFDSTVDVTKKTIYPLKYQVGGIAGWATILKDVHSTGTIKADTKTKIHRKATSDGVVIRHSNTYVGGIAGYASSLQDSSFKGDIVVAADDESSGQKQWNDAKADGKACVGGGAGIVVAGSLVNACNGIYVDGSISIEPKCESLSSTLAYAEDAKYKPAINYAGGIVGCYSAPSDSYVINSYANVAFTIEKGACSKNTVYWGGISSINPPFEFGNNIDINRYIVNNHAYTTYNFPSWGQYENAVLGGVTNTNQGGKIVNNFVSGRFTGDEKHENMAYYKSKLLATRGKYLYETYWNADIYGNGAKSSGSQITDASAKPFTFNAAKLPVTSNGESIHGLLSSNSGHDGGVLSANIPKYSNDENIYVNWKMIVDKDGNKVPVPMSTTSNY